MIEISEESWCFVSVVGNYLWWSRRVWLMWWLVMCLVRDVFRYVRIVNG